MNAFIDHYGHNSTYRHRIGLNPRTTPLYIVPGTPSRRPGELSFPGRGVLCGDPQGPRSIREGPLAREVL